MGEKISDIDKAKRLVSERYTVVQAAPSMKTVSGEAFGRAPGTDMERRLITLLRELGFRRVFETDFGAELRIMEESAELKEKVDSGKGLPLLTSCCPSWVGICVKMHPGLVPYLSTCKSPMEMVSSLTKSYLKEKEGLGDVGVVSIMPCFAKKMEVAKGNTDVELTIMELVQWANEEDLKIKKMKEGSWDTPMGMTSSAGTIYASTGGVAESTLRTFIDLFSGERFEEHLYSESELIKEGVREICVEAGGYKLTVAKVEGVKSIGPFCQKLIKDIKAGKNKYDLVEFMACTGGCVGGNGMPNQGDDNAITKRIKLLKDYDRRTVIKAAHDNPLIQDIYKSYLGKPFGRKAKKILHHTNFKEIFS